MMDPHSQTALVATPAPAPGGVDPGAVEALAPIVAALFGASMQLASARDLAGDQAGRVDDIIDQLDRAIGDLRRRVLGFGS